MAKKPKPRPKKLNLSVREIWKKIVTEVEKQEVPIEVLDRLVVHLADGTGVEINIKELLTEGIKADDIEDHLNKKLHALSDIIVDVDYFINIDSVVNVVKPETDRLLKDL